MGIGKIGMNPYADQYQTRGWGYDVPFMTYTPTLEEVLASQQIQPSVEAFSITPTSSSSTTNTSTQSDTTTPFSTPSTEKNDISAALQSLVNQYLSSGSSTGSDQSYSQVGSYGFPADSRDTYSAPITINGKTYIKPGISGSTTTESEWQSALDSVFPRKTGWNTATNW